MINRLVILCIVVLAISNAFTGMYIQSLSDVCAAYGFQCDSCEEARPFFAIAALGNVYKLRPAGIIGFIAAYAGRMDVAEKLLALHYGLVGIDSDRLVPIGRLAAGIAGATLAI